MTQIKRLVKNFFSLSMADLVSRIIGFFVTVYLANILGPRGFGQVNFALAFISYFLLMGDMGTGIFGTREISKHPERIRENVDNVISLRFFLGLISLLLYETFVWTMGFPVALRNLLSVYGLAIIPLSFLGEWIFQGMQRMGFIGIGRAVKATSYAVLVFLLVKGNTQVLRIPVCYAISISVAVLCLIGIYSKLIGTISLRFHPTLWRQILWKSVPIGFALIMSKVYYNMDSVFLGFMKGDYSVGVYSAAYKIILFILGFWFIFGNVTFPAITRLHARSSAGLEQFLSILVRLAFTISLPVAIGGTIVGNKIMVLIYPHGFEAGTGAFQILIWSVLIIALSTTYANFLIVLDRAKKYMWAVTFGAVTNTGLNFLLIPRFDFIGASLATVFTEALIFVYLYREIRGIHPFQVERIKRIVIASAFMGIFLYFMRSLPVLISVGLSMVVYLALLILLKGYTKEEFLMLKKPLSRGS